MSSLRTTLTDDNMDLVMHYVRKWDCNPSEVINRLLENPQHILDARSELYESKNANSGVKLFKK
jgi:hypothetical protein